VITEDLPGRQLEIWLNPSLQASHRQRGYLDTAVGMLSLRRGLRRICFRQEGIDADANLFHFQTSNWRMRDSCIHRGG
jgi:hypothetical protein